MQQARDEVYCHLVAKRAVARAALHLGIQAMTAESLDVLADVLLQYMQRIGTTAAYQVEASGRPSSHINVLDAIRAVELNTTAAVQHMHLPGELVADVPSAMGASAAVGTDARHQLGWKGLASFLFGPDWHLQSSTTATGTPTAIGASKEGGKVGPSAVAATTDAAELGNAADRTEKSNAVGWEAPYPEEVPAFPFASSWVANPHPLTSAAALESLHTTTIVVDSQTATSEGDNTNSDDNKNTVQDERVTLDVPDSVFTNAWGSYERIPGEEKAGETLPDTSTAGKRKRDDEDGEPAPKKAKVSFEAAKDDKAALVETMDHHDPASISHLLPPFYPPLPRTLDTHRRTVTDSETKPAAEASEKSDYRPGANDASSKSVRSALVQLGQQHYWGSGWDDDPEPALEVPPGGGTPGEVTPQIVPLGRASGSRVSRILEGSMDPGASM